MSANAFQVLSPWAEADPVPVKGINPRVGPLAGKRLGLLLNSKRAAGPILESVERRLRAQYPDLAFTSFANLVPNELAIETPRRDEFKKFVDESDAIIAAVGD